nr:hypothetical protein CTI12_AA504830 [Tanacetum cinerariifolium]
MASSSRSTTKSGSRRDQTLSVEDQKTEGHCIFIHLAEMASTTTPTYPYERLEHSHLARDNKKYRARGHPRYHLFKIDNLCKGKDPRKNVIKENLMEHFLGGGLKLLWVGDLYNTDSLRDFQKAKNDTFCHPRNYMYKKTATHSVLIVGIDVSAEEAFDHYVEVKYSWGENYGDKGFTRGHDMKNNNGQGSENTTNKRKRDKKNKKKHEVDYDVSAADHYPDELIKEEEKQKIKKEKKKNNNKKKNSSSRQEE